MRNLFKMPGYCILLCITLTACTMFDEKTKTGNAIISEYNTHVTALTKTRRDGKGISLEELREAKVDLGFITAYSSTSITDTSERVEPHKSWIGVPLTGHSYMNKTGLYIQLSAGFFSGFGVTIKKKGERLLASYYEYADGDGILKTTMDQQWNNSIEIEMNVQEAVFAEVQEKGKKIVYTRFTVQSLPFYRKVGLNNQQQERILFTLVVKCTPEQLPGNTKPGSL